METAKAFFILTVLLALLSALSNNFIIVNRKVFNEHHFMKYLKVETKTFKIVKFVSLTLHKANKQ